MASTKVKAPAKSHGGDIRGFFAKGSSQPTAGSSQTQVNKPSGAVSANSIQRECQRCRLCISAARMERHKAAQ